MSHAFALRRFILTFAVMLCPLVPAVLRADDTPPPASRETREIDGITFEFSPNHTALVTALAPKIAALNAESPAPSVATPKKPAEDDPTAPLTIAHFRDARDRYLGAIAQLSGQSAPTELQQAGYDEILSVAGALEASFEKLANTAREALTPRRVLVWDKSELIRRLKAGETIPGFTLGQDGESGEFQWGNEFDAGSNEEAAKSPAPKKAHFDFKHGIAGSRVVLDGAISAAPPPQDPPAVETSEQKQRKGPTAYPVVLTDEHAKLSTDELVETIFEKNIRAFREGIEGMQQHFAQIEVDRAALAFVLLKETARVGLAERLGDRPELRWLSEGGARYTAWRVLHERHAPETALAVYDARNHLARAAAQRGNVNFATWRPADAKRGSPAEQLDDAHEAYATMAFFVMAQRYGADSIPRFFAELSRTSPTRMNERAVERAFQKTTGKKLNDLLADVVKPANQKKRSR